MARQDAGDPLLLPFTFYIRGAHGDKLFQVGLRIESKYGG